MQTRPYHRDKQMNFYYIQDFIPPKKLLDTDEKLEVIGQVNILPRPFQPFSSF